MMLQFIMMVARGNVFHIQTKPIMIIEYIFSHCSHRFEVALLSQRYNHDPNVIFGKTIRNMKDQIEISFMNATHTRLLAKTLFLLSWRDGHSNLWS